MSFCRHPDGVDEARSSCGTPAKAAKQTVTLEQRQRHVSGARDSMPAGDADKPVEQESFLGHEGKKRAGATSGSKLPARALNVTFPNR